MLEGHRVRLMIILDWNEGMAFQIRLQEGQHASVTARRITREEWRARMAVEAGARCAPRGPDRVRARPQSSGHYP